VWCGVVSRGVWRGVAWRGVVWCGVSCVAWVRQLQCGWQQTAVCRRGRRAHLCCCSGSDPRSHDPPRACRAPVLRTPQPQRNAITPSRHHTIKPPHHQAPRTGRPSRA
jgi:hypothetical protein